ncbi:DUF3347 domain-containing protein [Salegentibacter chungangensis]|uniref:DUF3347 domain-containing protein n=1 Tax=Salegentibacter chungangensis TaxID=1335724 RepID=A0ABW3NP98_9FLAO
MKRIFIALLTGAIAASCNFGQEKQSVKIDTPKELKKEKKKVPDVADQDFKDGMTGKIFHNYLQIKMALANKDTKKASATAKSMAASFEGERKELKSLAEKLSNTSELEEQREIFAEFTEKTGSMFEDVLAGGTIYKKYCPMAFDGKGAYWFSDVERDVNPYFGDKMPDCGKVEKKITKK